MRTPTSAAAGRWTATVSRPLDGDRLADYGESLRVTLPRKVRDGPRPVRIVPTEVRGRYRREGEIYIWEPD
jgi:hypothetical protein